MKFKYLAKRVSGDETVEGVADAQDKFALAKNLKAEGLLVQSAKLLNEKSFSIDEFISNIFSRISMKEKIFFASNLAEMISAGLSLTRALSVLERQSTNKKFKSIVTDVTGVVNSGGTFSSALERFPKVFSPIFVAMSSAGERSGQLPESLKIVADQMQKNYALRKKVRGALIYPAIIICVMITIAVLMMIFVIPMLAKTFADIGAELPLSTRILLGSSTFLVEHGFVAFISFVLLVYGSWRVMKTNAGDRAWCWILLHAPIFKTIVIELNSAITARTLSSLISSGVDIVEAIGITEKVIQNPYYKEVLQQAALEIPKGKTLSSVFSAYPKLYPVFVAEILEVGEETGKMSDMMLKLAIFYENEVDAMTKDLSTVIEPLIMVLVGVGVAFFAVSLIQPIYSIGDKI